MPEPRCLDRGVVAWLTGLPGSGKTTIALRAARLLEDMGYRVEVIDGDWARATVSEGEGFTRDDRVRHLKRIAWIARLLARNGVIVICSLVSPYRDARAMARRIVEEEAPFIEVYVRASLSEVMRRDPKGLYRRALKGEISNFTGISDPYEPLENPDLVLDTEERGPDENAGILAERIIAVLSHPDSEIT